MGPDASPLVLASWSTPDPVSGETEERCPRCGRGRRAPVDFGLRAEMMELALEVSVPLAIVELQRLSWPVVDEIAKTASEVVGAQGDVAQFRTVGVTGPAFAAIARGLAALSFAVCGVRFLNTHWCAVHPEFGGTEGQYSAAGAP